MDRVGATIKALDPNHLVSSGIEGHGSAFGYGGDEGNNFTVIHSSPHVDFCSGHLYPTASYVNFNMSQAQHLVHQWAHDCHALGKPMAVLEFNVDTQHGSRPTWWKEVYAAMEDADVAADAFWWFEATPVDATYGILDGAPELAVFQEHAKRMASKSGERLLL